MIKIQIKTVFGSILFEHESENNTLLQTLQRANLEGANLQRANLEGANLQRADLRGADLRGADLRGADLEGANLRGADLQRADLQRADLRGADLRGADLQRAILRGADLQRADLQRADLRGADLPIFSKWSAAVRDDKICIGCKIKTVAEWDAFFASEEEFDTKRGTPEFKQIQAVYEAYRAYYTFLNSK